MKIEEYQKYIQEEYGIEADYPFAKEWAPSPVFRHKDNKKWFALAMFVPKCKICQSSKESVWVLNVKCDPILKSALMDKKGFYPAYHMNKEHWITILLDEACEDDVKFATDISFGLTKSKKKTKGK